MVNAVYKLGRFAHSSGSVTDYTFQPHTMTGIKFSVNHKRVKGTYREGGPFYMRKTETVNSSEKAVYGMHIFGGVYTGGHTVKHIVTSGYPKINDGFGTPAGDLKFQQDLLARGAEAWNKLRPDKPDFSLLSSVYELKDLPGMFRQAVKTVRDRTLRASKRSSLSYTGEYYLAIQFGWLPLYRDLRKFIKAHRSYQKRISQLIRDEGKSVRRRVQLADSEIASDAVFSKSYTSAYNPDMYPVLPTQCYQGGRASTTTRHTFSSKTWAVGSFRYFLPPGPRNVEWNRKMYRRIMGGRLSPSQIYAVIPWSWLVDYFTDLGQFIDAVSHGVADRLIADYAYLMRTVETKVSTEGTFYGIAGRTKIGNSYVYNTRSYGASRVTTYVQKARVAASPFGWGIKESSLSPQQMAILGALGLSRLP